MNFFKIDIVKIFKFVLNLKNEKIIQLYFSYFLVLVFHKQNWYLFTSKTNQMHLLFSQSSSELSKSP